MFGRLVARRGRSVEDGLQDAAHVADLAPDHVLSERAPKEEEESLGARLGRLLSSEELADVHLLVGVASGSPRLRVPAHRLLLAAASPVLRALLFSGEPCAELELPDSEPAAVLEFLRFVYTDHVTLSAPLAPQVLFLARRFHVTALQNHVDTFLRRALCGHNALAVWWSSRRLALTDWEALAMRVVRQFASEAFRSRHVTRLDESALLHVLQDDELRAPEAELFAGACRWAKNQLLRRGLCPTRALVREQMARALELIRFPLMTSDQIRSHVAPEGVLDDDTLRALLSQSRTWHAHQSRASLALNCCPRAQQRLERPVVTVQRFQSFDNQLPFAATWRALLFSVSRDVFVAGFGVHGPRRALPFDLEVEFSVARSDVTQPTVLDRAEGRAHVRCDSSQPIITLRLERAFHVLAGVAHVLEARVRAPKDVHFFYGIEPTASTAAKDVVFSFEFAQPQSLDAELKSRSLPATPLPPPRPPPPKEYRRASRIARLKRALSFSERRAEPEEVAGGQVAVIQFFA